MKAAVFSAIRFPPLVLQALRPLLGETRGDETIARAPNLAFICMHKNDMITVGP